MFYGHIPHHDLPGWLIGGTAGRDISGALARHKHIATTLLVDQLHEAEAETLFCNAEALLNAANPPIRSIRGSTAERAIVLESRASQPDLVVFGPLSKGGWQRWLGQSAVRSLARRLTTSILLMRGRPNELRRALLCTAGGREGIVDARVTAALFGPLNGQATVLHIVSQMPLMFNRDLRNPDHLAEVVMGENTRVNRNIAAVQTVLSEAGVSAKIRIRVGMVVEQIKEELQVGGYDLLVIGAHHARTPLDRVLLEDLSAELLLDSAVPVLVVHNAG
jgi:nucleotide-binding universal stress UspA family protein